MLQVIQAWAAVAGVAVSFLMVFVTLAGFWFVWRQVVLMRQAIQHDSQTTLYHENFECTRALLEKEGLYLYFRRNKPFSDDFTDGRWVDRDGPESNGVEVTPAAIKRWQHERKLYCNALELSELFASHFEHVVLQMGTLPEDLRRTWCAYMRDVYRQSPVLRRFLADHRDWYSADLRAVLGSGTDAGHPH